MKILGLLRHAKADFDDPAARDFDRGLSRRGRKGAALVGPYIANQDIGWDAVIASPAERVRQTLEAAGLPLEPHFDERAYLAEPETLIELLRTQPGEPANVLVVGHNPGLHELLFRLVDPDDESALVAKAQEKFPTAAFAMLELKIDRWSGLTPACAKLIRFIRPRDLDPDLGPQGAHKSQ